MHDVTERVYGHLPHAYVDGDAANNYALLRYLSLLTDQIGSIEDTAENVETTLGSVALCDRRWLLWLFWIAGLQPVPGTESVARALAMAPSARSVGSTEYITGRVARFLTGAKYVRLVPKDQTLRPVLYGALGLDDVVNGIDDPLYGLDSSITPTPGVWQIRVETVPGETPADIELLLEPYRPAGYRFISANALAPSTGLDDPADGLDDPLLQLD